MTLREEEINELIVANWYPTMEFVRTRTNLTSALIPVRAYIALAGIEAWKRWPEILEAVSEIAPPEEWAEGFRRPGTGCGGSYVWALPNLPSLGGRVFWRLMGDPMTDEAERLSTLFDFWRRTVTTWRADGFMQAWDANHALRPYPREVTDTIADAATGLDEARLASTRRALATVTQYLFLLWLENRMGIMDTGPYPLPNGRTMIVRELLGLDGWWLPWGAPARVVPRRHLVVGLVYRPGLQNRVTDFGQTFSTPDDPYAFLDAVAVLDADLEPVDDLDAVVAACRDVQKTIYRTVAGWSWEERVLAGAHAYFCGLIRPWPAAAGIVDDIDWTLPLARPDALDLLREIEDTDDADSPVLKAPLLVGQPVG